MAKVKLMAAAMAVVLSATVTIAMAQSVPNADSLQPQTPSAEDPAVRAAVTAAIEIAPLHPQTTPQTSSGDQTIAASNQILSALAAGPGAEALAPLQSLTAEPAPR